MKKLIFFSIIFCTIVYMGTFLNIQEIEKYFDISFTYLSITIGFVVTSLTIIASSKYSKILYDKQSPDNNSKSLLHVLLGRFKLTIIVFAMPMILILIFVVLPWSFFNIFFRKIYDSFILCSIISTFPMLLMQINLICKFIIQNAKEV